MHGAHIIVRRVPERRYTTKYMTMYDGQTSGQRAFSCGSRS